MAEQLHLYAAFTNTPVNFDWDANNYHVVVHIFQDEVMTTLKENTWSSMWQVIALVEALKMPIWSIYPHANINIRHLYHRLIQPVTTSQNCSYVLPIMWTGYWQTNTWFVANHFVPLISMFQILDFTVNTISNTSSSIEDVHLEGKAFEDIAKRTKHKEDVPLGKTKDNIQGSNYACATERKYCEQCLKMFVTSSALSKITTEKLCSTCKYYQRANMENPFQWKKLNPGTIPVELNILNSTELKLVSRIHPYSKIIRLPRGGQFAERGQVICIPVPHQQLSDILPRPIDESGDLLIQSAKGNSIHTVNSHRIHSALSWLRKNNELYHSVTLNKNYATDTVVACDESDTDEYKHVALACEDYVTPNEKKVTKLPIIKGTPVNIFQDKNTEELCFPNLYPYGINGKDQIGNRSLQNYFKTRLLNKDSRWRHDIQYLFWSTYVYEQNYLQNCISIAMRFKGNMGGISVNQLHAGIPRDIAEDYSFMKDIRGTASYWRNQLYNLLAKIRTLGPPTFFVSLSANDMHWPELFMFIDSTLTWSEANALPAATRCNMLKENYVLASIYFSFRWNRFLHTVLLAKSEPLGKITDYFARVEFQNRGSPHMHIFLWIKNAPDLDTEEGRNEAPTFIDKYISARIPPPQEQELHKLVTSLQIHHHTDTCFKQKSRKCRFDYPQPLSEQTRQKTLYDGGNPARFYILKRSVEEKWVNPYNPVILKEWNANMDIQLVGNKYAAAMYVCTYVCKQEPQSLKNAIKTSMQSVSSDASIRKKLSKLGNALLTHRILSAQEASFRILGLPLVYIAVECLYI